MILIVRLSPTIPPKKFKITSAIKPEAAFNRSLNAHLRGVFIILKSRTTKMMQITTAPMERKLKDGIWFSFYVLTFLF